MTKNPSHLSMHILLISDFYLSSHPGLELFLHLLDWTEPMTLLDQQDVAEEAHSSTNPRDWPLRYLEDSARALLE